VTPLVAAATRECLQWYMMESQMSAFLKSRRIKANIVFLLQINEHSKEVNPLVAQRTSRESVVITSI